MLLNTISSSSEKIIWDYYHQFNNYDKKIKNIFDKLILGEFTYDKKNSSYFINFLDFIEYYIENIHNLNLKIFYDDKTDNKRRIIQIYKVNNNNFFIKENKKIVPYDFIKKFNVNIKEIIKFKNSDLFYILL